MTTSATILVIVVVLALVSINLISAKATNAGKKASPMEYVIILAVMAMIALAVYAAGMCLLGQSTLSFVDGATSGVFNINNGR